MSDREICRPSVLFACTRYGGRALLAKAAAEKEAGDKMDFFASGFERAEVGQRVSACAEEIDLVVEAQKDGIPTVFERKKSGETFDRVVMLCDPNGTESCELFEKHIKFLFGDPVDNRLWPVADLARLPRDRLSWMQGARPIRDEIVRRVHEFMNEF